MRYLGVVSVLLSVVVVGPALAMLGDVDGSGRVDGVDLTILSRLLGSTRGDAVFRETADLNGDGRIDEKDVAILRANFARTGRGQNVWVADTANDRLVELSPMTGHTLVTVGGVPAPVRLALDTGRGDVWAIAAGGTQVVHVSPSGRRLATVRGFGKATALAVDPGDGSCWVADRNARKLYGLRHNAPDGSDVSASRSFYRLVEGLSYGTLGPTCLALDGSRGVLWLADGRLVRLLTSVPAYYNLSTGTGSHWINYQQLPATVLAVNQLDGTCFTGSAQAGSLVRVGATNSGTVLTVANLPGLNGMAANGMDGSVWLATTGQDSSGTTTQLIHLGNDGTELSRASISGFADLGVDPSSGEVWVANPLANGVSRYSAGGSCTLQASQFSRPTAVQPFPGDPILGAPVVSAVVNPTRAEVGQPVTFFANLLSGRNPVARVEWDFTGRGVFDFSSGTSFTTTRAYQAAGVFNPIVRVTDTAGLSGTDYTALVRVGGLSVRLGASIVQGTAPLTVNFTASAVNPSGAPLANFQWDFDGDGVYDAYQTATGSTATASHTYAAGGTFDAAVKVIDSQARMASGSVVVHVAAPVPTLTLWSAIGRLQSSGDLHGSRPDERFRRGHCRGNSADRGIAGASHRQLASSRLSDGNSGAGPGPAGRGLLRRSPRP
ncbi:MAG: PKD domain-containing protein [Candidatus Wallbacteria bacterium]|nr:PKD domain-containing protein [Candidatus Wallbacteria bacterium]